MFDISGKVAVVTGAGDGIGKGVARILSAAGARVVVSDIDADKARAVAESIGAFGGSAAATACNVLVDLSRIHNSEPTRPNNRSRMPTDA